MIPNSEDFIPFLELDRLDTITTHYNGNYKKVDVFPFGTIFEKQAHPNPTFEADDVEMLPEIQNYFRWNKKLPKLPQELWEATVKLYVDYCNIPDVASLISESIEVRVNYYINTNDLSFKGIVWKQIADRGSVTHVYEGEGEFRYMLGADLLTGEFVTYPLDSEWMEWGDSHSHNTLKIPDFSNADDWDELKTNGVHILVHSINLEHGYYIVNGSVTLNGRRYYEMFGNLVEGKYKYSKFKIPFSYVYSDYRDYHSNVKQFIMYEVSPDILKQLNLW